MARAPGADPRRPRLRADRATRPGRGRRGAGVRLARRAGRLSAREGGLVRYVGIALVWLYRLTFGALFPTTCKYHPSCSQYAIDALRRYGLIRGSVLAGWRLLRCHPWARGGVDRVEDQRLFQRGETPGSPANPLPPSGTVWQ